ncbi:unnamed protein product [Didymodactylos carnosus]|uniref:K Homology domain-containing protein n=1 Tax=Didymodactylos carnosus TaxID=1234261 RepID=A0A814LUG9_9BILA|nr:unnamed protein product [Didymodactylos carnosus]CAF1070482.1 unnamed protein product [Didymodactylos carnosus]CAF3648159.1 unnamed protein product [Didymodactylos carnosus]CAF3837624.1 unnamed protein product [Didymodactylos carnosus]
MIADQSVMMENMNTKIEGNDGGSAGNKRPYENDQQQQPQQPSQLEVKRSRISKVDCRFLLQSRDAGCIIGKGGKTIQQLRTTHRTIIQVPDCDAPERVLTITGDMEQILECVANILNVISENQRVRPDISEIRALIHQSQAGAIIGKGGQRVKEFREKYNLDVKVYPQCAPGGSTERCISMRGQREDVMRCLKEVYSILESVPPRGPSRYYDPNNYDGYNVQEYGGFPDGQNQQRRGGFNNNNNNRNNYNNFNNNNNNNNYNQQQGWNNGGNDGYGGRGGGNYNDYDSRGGNSQGNAPGLTTTQVTIPNDLAGCVIGARGSRISQIRQQSGAEVRIDSQPLQDTNDRVISITGTPQQIQQAQYLLQMAVKQSGLWQGQN